MHWSDIIKSVESAVAIYWVYYTLYWTIVVKASTHRCTLNQYNLKFDCTRKVDHELEKKKSRLMKMMQKKSKITIRTKVLRNLSVYKMCVCAKSSKNPKNRIELIRNVWNPTYWTSINRRMHGYSIRRNIRLHLINRTTIAKVFANPFPTTTTK